MSQENPRIGKVLRVPIEIVLEDEHKIDEAIQKLSKAQGQGVGLGSTGTAAGEADEAAATKKALSKTKLGDLVVLSKDQISNLTSFAKAPDAMLLRVFLRKFAKGAGAILLAFVIMEAIKFGIEYLTRDGMPLDRRFKRIINAEIAGFMSRMMKAQLRQGFRTLIATTIGGLRGGQGQIGGNIYSIMDRSISSKIPPNFYGREITNYDARGFNPTGGVTGSHKAGGFGN